MKTEIEDVEKFLNQVVDEYSELLIEQTKLLILNENEENYEQCHSIKEYMNMVSNNVATTISEMSGVDYQVTMNRLIQMQKFIYTNLFDTQE
jgi:cell division septum initiation protein DivIVA